MSKDKTTHPGYGNLLDAWIPPDEAGEPIGCLATTFTFNANMFEEECLNRFLQLESDSVEDGPAYLIEREEKLAQLSCAAVLVDQHNARGIRNLRWDLLSARVPRAILHAKLSLLLWQGFARVIITSANLTEDGYRRNHEVFGVLDYYKGSKTPLAVLHGVINFLDETTTWVVSPQDRINPATQRWKTFLAHVTQTTRKWGAAGSQHGWVRPKLFPIFTGPDRPDVFAALREDWPDSTPPHTAYVLSPFFDPPEAPNEPAKQIWSLLKQRGDAYIEFHVTAEDVPNTNKVLLHAPKSLIDGRPRNRDSAKISVKRLKLEDSRPLHAKSMWLESDRYLVYLMGSSNFTSDGLGLSRAPNLEANLAYIIDHTQTSEAAKAFNNAWLPADDIPNNVTILWKPRREEGEDAPTKDALPLPHAFADAIFGRDTQQRGFIEFTFNGVPPTRWILFVEDEMEQFISDTEWLARGKHLALRIDWTRERPPSVFRVVWKNANGFAWWPVNVENSEALPPPSDLRDLSLDALLEILTSAKPLHKVLAGRGRRRKKPRKNVKQDALDPHKRVDTSSFLLQRTKRVSWALEGLRQRLEKPTTSEQTLAWRLRGPIGALALASAISKEAQSERERYFLLVELCLEISRIKTPNSPGCLSPKRIRSALLEVIQEIRGTVSKDALADDPILASYFKNAFNEMGV
jgi:hypothetical protein